MEQIKVYYDDIGHTLSVWFDNSRKEVISEEVGDGVILMKSEDGTVVGFEKLNVMYSNPQNLTVALNNFSN